MEHEYWEDEMNEILYLRNRSLIVAVYGQTPYEAWTGIEPTI